MTRGDTLKREIGAQATATTALQERLMRALAYLEWCYARHSVEAILRSPGRVALWTLYAVSLGIFAWARSMRAKGSPHFSLGTEHGVLIGLASAYVCSYGIIIALAAGGRVATFRSPAEATLMLNGGVRPLTIAVWLELRKIVAGWARIFGAFSYVVLTFTPLHTSAFATLRVFAATLLVLGVTLSAQLPAFLLARGRASIPVRMFGWAVAACGLVYTLAGLGGPYMWGPLVRISHIDPIVIPKAIFSGAPAAFAVPLAILAAYVLIVVVRGNDALPELFAASKRAQTRVRRNLRDAALTDRESYGSEIYSERVPPGAAAIVWKEWIALRRGRTALSLWIAGAVIWIVCGVGAAEATLQWKIATPLLFFGTIAAVVILYWAPLSASAGLASDLGKPIFWLSVVPLRTRLAAWPFARAWRAGAVLGCGLGAALLVLGQPLSALLCIPLAVAAYWSLQALGIGFYAIFPNPLDARGPTTVLRLVTSVAFMIPAIVLASGARFVHIGSLGVLIALVCGLVLEGWLVIGAVALRFTEYGASLATITQAPRG